MLFQKELRAVLDFMYNGEVSVSQDSLNNFLSAAEELAVKGLTANDGPTNLNATHSHFDDDQQVTVYNEQQIDVVVITDIQDTNMRVWLFESKSWVKFLFN